MDKAKFGGQAFDSLLMLRDTDDGSLSHTDSTGTTETTAGVEIQETPADGMTARVIVPAVTADHKLTVEIQAADTDADASYETVAQSEAITAVGEYNIRFATQRTYVRQKSSLATDGTASTAPDFGKIIIGVVPGGF
jgi:5-hydroxyisourate hydrolase-like protein (transthyretin family)